MTIDFQNIICKSIIKKKASELSKIKRWHLYREKKNVAYMPLKNIKDYQLEKLKVLLKIASRAPFYKKYIDTLGKPIEAIELCDLKKFPILTKNIIRENRSQMLTKDPTKLFAGSSGGSTGEPLHFFHDDHYLSNNWAGMMVINEMGGWYYGARYARLWGALKDNGPLNNKRGLYLQNSRFYNTFDMSAEKMQAYHEDLEKYKPDVILAFASSMFLLANYLKANGIKPSYPGLSIITTAEPLYPRMRSIIEDVFGVKCFNRYGSREISGIACECEAHNGLHVMMDNVIIECIDPVTGKDVLGKPGELIITDLSNHGMPFIRYNIGDTAILSSHKCSCGRNSTVIDQIVGRNVEHFTMHNGKIIHGCFFSMKIFMIEGIKAFQFIQESITRFTLNLVKANDFDNPGFATALADIQKTVGATSHVQVNFVNSIPTTPTGKYSYVSSKVDPASAWNQNKINLR